VEKKFHSLPEYYGYYLAAWCGLPALIILFFWSLSELYIVKVLILSDFRADPTIDDNKLNLIFSQIQAIAEKQLFRDYSSEPSALRGEIFKS
jgi:phosphate transport system permease protein